MTYENVFRGNANTQGAEVVNNNLSLEVVDYGPGNVGTLGPSTEEDRRVVGELAHNRYSLPATRRWICIDGRCCANDIEVADLRQDADPQTAGSLPITETAVSFMDDPSTHQPLSSVIAEKTSQEVADGYIPVVHGDTAVHKGGCKANAAMRQILRFIAENADVIAAQTWEGCKKIGLEEWIKPSDILEAIANGKKAADNDVLWDVTPEQVVGIAIANGAEYEEYQGPHYEVTDRDDNSEGAFAKGRFVKDHTQAGKVIQVFSTSTGAYKAMAFERAQKHGQQDKEAALNVMRAKLFNRGAKKMLLADRVAAVEINS